VQRTLVRAAACSCGARLPAGAISCCLLLPRYWLHVEASYVDLATYYRLPLLSVKACCYHLMTEGVKGFKVDQWRRWARG
jgi:hypothetical protein